MLTVEQLEPRETPSALVPENPKPLVLPTAPQPPVRVVGFWSRVWIIATLPAPEVKP
jgi:hypothetical protein